MNIEEYLKYHPRKGVLRWIKSPSQKIKVGALAGSVHNEGYRKVRLNGKEYLVHRVAWFLKTGAWPIGDLDHKNHDRSDNRFCNLRPATRAQNLANRARVHGRAFGVHWYAQTSRWKAGIKVDGVHIHLGYFLRRADAIKVRRKAEIEHFKEFRSRK